MRIKNNQAILNAPFGSILLTFADGDLIKCELSEAAVEEDLGSFVGHKSVLPAETIRFRFLSAAIVLSGRAIWADSHIPQRMSQ